MSEAQFNKAANIITNLPKDGPIKPTTDDQLYFYKYYKQATIGNNQTARPGMMEFTNKAKWNAWTSVSGTSKADAYKAYVDKFIEILKGVDDETSRQHIAEIEAAV